MTFDEIVQDVMDRLNLTSEDARNRIGIRVNDRYRRATTSIGMITSRRTMIPITIDPDVSTTLPDYIVDGMEKVLRITRTDDNSGGVSVLPCLTYDEITNVPVNDRSPRAWAVKRMGSNNVTITFDTAPTEPFTLKIEGYDLADVLADDAEPHFPASYHDLLVEGAMADELKKMEKPQFAVDSEQRYQERLSDLKMFIARNAYMDMYQGKTKPNELWYRPWNIRTSIWN